MAYRYPTREMRCLSLVLAVCTLLAAQAAASSHHGRRDGDSRGRKKCVENPFGVFGDVATLGGCKRCDATKTTCLECADQFHLRRGTCRLNKCVEAPDGIQGDYVTLGGCRVCNEEATRCVECHDFFGLSSRGTCSRCDPKRRTDALVCIDCKGDNPDVCTDCTGNVEGDNEFAYYANRRGRCIVCPEASCTACENVSGTCTECARGYGLQEGGRCEQCDESLENCLSCNGDTGRCSECTSGYFPNPDSGKCEECPANCVECSSSGTCEECESFGYTLDPETQLCVACSEGCFSCSAPDSCEGCDSSYRLVPGEARCERCADQYCTICNAAADQCTVCDDPGSKYGVDVATGACILCQVGNCANCQDDASSCRLCKEGYWNDVENKACPLCKNNCARCSTDMDGQEQCDECDSGYEFESDQPGAQCVPSSSAARN